MVKFPNSQFWKWTNFEMYYDLIISNASESKNKIKCELYFILRDFLNLNFVIFMEH